MKEKMNVEGVQTMHLKKKTLTRDCHQIIASLIRKFLKTGIVRNKKGNETDETTHLKICRNCCFKSDYIQKKNRRFESRSLPKIMNWHSF